VAGVVAVEFKIAGTESVTRAIRLVTQATESSARAVARASQGAAQVRQASTKAVADAERAAAKVATDAARQTAREQARAAREVVAVVRQANREKAVEEAKAAAASIAQARRVAREQTAANREATRNAQAAARAWSGGMGEGAGTYKGAIGRGLGQGVRTVVGPAALAAAGVGSATVAAAVKSQLDLSGRSAAVQNTTGLGYDFTRMSRSVSSQYGIDAGEVMGGLEAISGKAGTAGFDAMGAGPAEVTRTLSELAMVARSAGVSMTDLGDVVGTMVNRGAKGKELVTVVRGLVEQGKAGAVEFKDLATMLDESSGALVKFKMGESERLTSAGGLSQIARANGSKSAAEATTAVKALARDLAGKGDLVQELTGGTLTSVHTKGKKTMQLVGGRMIETTVGDKTEKRWAGGIEIGTDSSRTTLRNLNDSLPDVIASAVANGKANRLTGAGGIFTDEAASIITPLVQAATKGVTLDKGRYRLAGDGEKAQLSGRAAVDAMLKQSEQAIGSEADTRKAFNNVMAQDGAKLAVAMNRLTNDMADRLAPAVSKLATDLSAQGPAIGKAAEVLATGITTAVQHPLAAGLGVVTASVAKSLVAQMIANRISAMSVTAGVVNVSGGVPGGGGAPTPGGPGLGSKLATLAGTSVGAAGAGAVAGTVVAGGAIGAVLGHVVSGGIESDLQKRESRAATASNLASKIRMGNATAEDMAQAKGLVGQLGEDQSSGWMSRMWKNSTAGARGLLSGDFSAANLLTGIPLPPMLLGALGRGVVGAGLEGQQQGIDKNTGAAAAELKAALEGASVRMAPGTTINIGNPEAIAAAMPKTGGRDATAQPIAGN
jgi:hypothetical protein